MPELEIQCPRCMNNHAINTKESINTKSDVQDYEKLLNGTYFYFTCPTCNVTLQVPHNVLLHDVDHKAMVFYCKPEENQETFDTIQSIFRDGVDQKLQEYQIRIVNDVKTLREKAQIFQRGYDDKSVELWKMTYLYHLAGKREDFVADKSYLVFKDNDALIEFYNQGKLVLTIKGDINMLDGVKKRFLSQEFVNSYQIDEIWAKEHLSNLLHRK